VSDADWRKLDAAVLAFADAPQVCVRCYRHNVTVTEGHNWRATRCRDCGAETLDEWQGRIPVFVPPRYGKVAPLRAHQRHPRWEGLRAHLAARLLP
jgi:ribosomal protein L40E